MYNNSCNNNASSTRVFAALCAVLAMMTSAAEASPFAYVANYFSNTVSVIDTATNTVVGTPKHCFGDRHRHQHGCGDPGPGGN